MLGHRRDLCVHTDAGGPHPLNSPCSKTVSTRAGGRPVPCAGDGAVLLCDMDAVDPALVKDCASLLARCFRDGKVDAEVAASLRRLWPETLVVRWGQQNRILRGLLDMMLFVLAAA